VSVRSVIGVLGGIVIIAVLTQLLELPLVNLLAPAPLTDMAGYMTARNQPSVHVGLLAIAGVVGLLAGYVVAKIAGEYELAHAAVTALLQGGLLIRSFGDKDAAADLPPWVKVGLVAVTTIAMLLGASVRARAARLTASSEVKS
jgi:hypothetical protein